MAGESESIQYVKAWQCIGCGKIEAPQPCVGICQDRKVEFVYRFEHEEALAQLEAARRRLNALESIARRLAWTKPHDDEWEHSFRVLQGPGSRSGTQSERDGRRRTADLGDALQSAHAINRTRLGIASKHADERRTG